MFAPLSLFVYKSFSPKTRNRNENLSCFYFYIGYIRNLPLAIDTTPSPSVKTSGKR